MIKKIKIVSILFILSSGLYLNHNNVQAFTTSSSCDWNAANHWCNFVVGTEYWLCYSGGSTGCQEPDGGGGGGGEPERTGN